MIQLAKKIFLLTGLLLTVPLLAEKTDIVYLLNGDKITCEIKTLEYGQLKVKTDDMGTLEIKWNSIAKIVSKNYFELELTDGTKYFGFLPVRKKTNIRGFFFMIRHLWIYRMKLW